MNKASSKGWPLLMKTTVFPPSFPLRLTRNNCLLWKKSLYVKQKLRHFQFFIKMSLIFPPSFISTPFQTNKTIQFHFKPVTWLRNHLSKKFSNRRKRGFFARRTFYYQFKHLKRHPIQKKLFSVRLNFLLFIFNKIQRTPDGNCCWIEKMWLVLEFFGRFVIEKI